MSEEQKYLRKNATAKSAAKAQKKTLTPALSPPRGEGVKPPDEGNASGTPSASLKNKAARDLLLPGSRTSTGRRIEGEGATSKLTQAKARYRTRTEPAKKFARTLRQHSTDAEKRLWGLLRDRRFNEFKFRRQYACGIYFLDFYCPDALLAVELDGSGHGFPGQQEKDTLRDDFLALQGIKVMRFWNHQLAKELASIRETIWYELMKRTGRTQEIAHYLRLPNP